MKRLATLFLCAAIGLTAMAVPSDRQPRLVTLTDGSTVMAILYGDEHFSWLETTDGHYLQPNDDGTRYTLTDVSGREMARRHLARQRELAEQPRHVGSRATAALPSLGSPKIPVVLVNFQDSVFSVADTDEGIHDFYDLYCNGTRDGQLYQGHGSYGSVRDYFVAQSDSLFQPEFVIIGPVTLDHPEGYYGGDRGSARDSLYSQFRTDAIRKATEAYDGDWMDFDNRGKQQVDLVFFIFAGCGQANGGAASTIWPKESPSSVNIAGIKFATSAVCNANRPVRNYVRPDGIGIMCHELSHALGLPDFYDTSMEAFGMDLWSLMDYGCYGSSGYRPCAYTAYEREFMGWKPLVELTEAQNLTIAPIAAGGQGYKIVNDENPDEYYIIENRQQTGWDQGICQMGHGLQVTHVDYLASAWNSNSVNRNANHQRMTIIAANNRYIGTSQASATVDDFLETWKGNLYPFEGNDSLTTLSTPAATVFSASGFMHKDLLNIHENDDLTVSLSYIRDTGTGIGHTEGTRSESDSDAPLLDLRGLPVGQPRPGNLYIRHGQKLIWPAAR